MTNFLQVLFPCPKCKELTRKNTDGSNRTHLCFEEINYWRGYIDAKVEDLGKVRVMAVSEARQIEYRDKLLKEKGLLVPDKQ